MKLGCLVLVFAASRLVLTSILSRLLSNQRLSTSNLHIALVLVNGGLKLTPSTHPKLTGNPKADPL